MLQMELPGKMFRGRHRRRYWDWVNQDMEIVGVSVEDASKRASWKEAICCADPNPKKLKEITAKTLFELSGMLYVVD